MKCKRSYKDMEKFNEYRYRYNKKYYQKTSYSLNNWKKWDDEEIKLIKERKYTDRELAKMIGRSMAAIQAKRRNIKRMEEE